MFVFDKIWCPKFKLQKKNFMKRFTTISGYWFALKKEHYDVRANEVKVTDIITLREKDTVDVKS